jgi:glycosyltransferase involved in cell wall biosynthesis
MPSEVGGAQDTATWLGAAYDVGLVSVIIPTRNRAALIEQTLDSVWKQTYRPLEIIIVDDGSDDATPQVVQAWFSRHTSTPGITLRFDRQTMLGASAARNRGMRHARGELIQFLDSDDLISPDKIEAQVTASRARPGAVVTGRWQCFTGSGDAMVLESSARFIDPARDIIAQWFEGEHGSLHSLLWPRTVIDRIGPWDESLAANQDGELLLRALLGDYTMEYCGEGVAYTRVHEMAGASISRDNTPDRVQSHIRVLEYTWDALVRRGVHERYRRLVALDWYFLAKRFAGNAPEEAGYCFGKFRELGHDVPIPGTLTNRLGTWLLGFRRKELLARLVSRLLTASR